MQRTASAVTLTLCAAFALATLPSAAGTGTASDAPSLPAAHGHDGAMPKKKAAPAQPVKLVDINRAGRKELKTLPGIGDAEAERIIANRPYMTKTELVGKNVLPLGPYMSLKNKVIALPKGKVKGQSQTAGAANKEN